MQDSLFKKTSTFLITFLLGSVSLHGILYFTITDANFYWVGGSLYPLILLLILYGAVPLIMLNLWRVYTGSGKLFTGLDNTNPSYKKLVLSEKMAIAAFWAAVFSFGLAIIFLLTERDNHAPRLIYVALAFVFISILPICFLVYYYIKTPKEEAATNDASAKIPAIGRELKLEGFMVLGVWMIVLSYVISAIVPALKKNEIRRDKIKNELSYAKKALNSVDSLLDFNQQLFPVLQVQLPTDTVNGQQFKLILQKVDIHISALYQNSKKANLSALKESYQEIKNIVFSGKYHQEEAKVLYDWLTTTDKKLQLVKHKKQGDLAQALFSTLLLSQAFYLPFMLILMLYGSFFGLLILDRNRKHLAAGGEEVVPLPEMDSVKTTLIVIFVFIVPILKPLEKDSIKFDKPFWSARFVDAVKPSLRIETLPEAPVKPAQVIIPATPPSGADTTINTSIDPIKPDDTLPTDDSVLKELQQINKQLNSIVIKDYSTEINQIENKLVKIERELKNSKKR